MRILTVHNHYQQKGGEDVVFAEETQMLRDNGHDVAQFVAHNDDLKDKSMSYVAINTLWSRSSKQAISGKIAEFKPDIVHFHNTFMSISPSAYYACRAANVPVVQTLHNYRLICPKATLFRDGKVCEACINSLGYAPSVRYGCYRGSKVQTAGVMAMLNLHRVMNTWDRQVDRYVCLSESGRDLFIRGGFQPEKLVVKGNFLQFDPGFSDVDNDFFLFMGRLTPEKGVDVLVKAWRELPHIPLKILGTGELEAQVKTYIAEHGLTHVEMPGYMPREQAFELLQTATAQIVPSQWYEPFGLVAIEAFACGKPVIASRIGALADIIEDGQTGLHFDPTDPSDLARQVQWLWDHRDERRVMAQTARKTFETHYTSQTNYEQLVHIYHDVLS